MQDRRMLYSTIPLLALLLVSNPGCVRRTSVRPVQEQVVEQVSQPHNEPIIVDLPQQTKPSAEQVVIAKPSSPKTKVDAKVTATAPEPTSQQPVTPAREEPKKNSADELENRTKKQYRQKQQQDIPLEEHLVKVNFENEDLAVMINHFAELQQQNIILPQGAETLNQKVTFRLPHEITLKEVNRYLDTFLDLAGYSRVPHGTFYRIVKTDSNISREALPLYVGVEPDALPTSDERIRVIYYLKNLRVPEHAQGTDPIIRFLDEMLSTNRSYLFDTKANALVIADKASNIKAVMKLITDLDATGSKDVVRAIPLYNTAADTIAKLVSAQILAMSNEEQTQALLPGANRAEASKYFISGTRVVADPRTNSLLVMGREPAVERMQDFITNHLDTPTDSGKSIIHFYELQYLDAEKFAPVLQKIVTEQIAASGQATQQSGGSAYHVFDNVIVEAEKVVAEKVEEKKLPQTTNAIESILTGEVYRGGNRIIVMALNQDWKRIERLISELDKPQLQVLIQVMILEFTLNENKVLSAQTRNPAWLTLPKGLNFQSANLAKPILNGPTSTGDYPNITYTAPTTVAADLLRLFAGSAIPTLASFLTAQTANIGSTIFSINDPSSQTPGTWSLIQWLAQFGTVKVVSHPYLVVVNNNRGEENVSTIRRVPGPAQTGEGGAIATKLIDIEAALKVAVVPRASSEDRVNLQVSIKIETFEGTSANLATRQVHTNVNLSTGDTIVLGGLTQDSEFESETQTPLLGRIPILRLLFSGNSKNVSKTNLLVLISPTIVQPKIRSGINQFSADEARKTHNQLRDSQLFGSLKDPVSYFFFDDKSNPANNMLDEYLADSITGDFVFRDIPLKDPSNHHCASDTQMPKTALLEEELRQKLAPEDNPLLTGHSAPQQSVLNRK